MRRSLAYAKALADKRQRGERVGLLVVALHDWRAGQWFEGRPEVGRVVLPADLDVQDADWTIALALDVLVCGLAPDDVFYSACSALEKAGAASIFGEFDDGLWLMERAEKLWYATEGPFPVQKLGAVLRSHREVMMMLRRGFYGSRIFDGARRAIASETFGVAL